MCFYEEFKILFRYKCDSDRPSRLDSNTALLDPFWRSSLIKTEVVDRPSLKVSLVLSISVLEIIASVGPSLLSQIHVILNCFP